MVKDPKLNTVHCTMYSLIRHISINPKIKRYRRSQEQFEMSLHCNCLTLTRTHFSVCPSVAEVSQIYGNYTWIETWPGLYAVLPCTYNVSLFLLREEETTL